MHALFTQWQSADETKSRVEKELDQAGYDIKHDYSSGRDELTINSYGTLPRDLVAFDEETARTEEKLAGLKREFTLRLFAGAEEARGLFSALSTELATILK